MMRLEKRVLKFYQLGIIFSDIRRHFIELGKARKEISITLPTTKIALGDGCARQKTRETNETTRQRSIHVDDLME